MAYPQLDGKPIIPAADLLDMQSSANRPGVGNSRVGSVPSILGKTGGLLAFRDAGSGNLSLVFALGANPSDGWREADGNATRTPLNIGAFTPAAGCSYSSGLLTADGVDDPTATTTITALAAGTYNISGVATAEGTLADHDAPKLVVTGATDGVKLTKIFRGKFHPTAAENATDREAFSYDFTLAVAQNVTITLSCVNEAGALEAGSSYIVINPLQSK